MTTMNNEDPADPSVHEPRELPEPAAYLPAYELDRLRSGHTAMLRSAKFGPSEMDGDVPVYTADAAMIAFDLAWLNERIRSAE